MLNTKQLEAERAVHQALEAGDESMLETFADFAAGEIDDKHIAALLLAILLADSGPWSFMLAGVRSRCPDLADAIDKLENELERQRAHFIEAQACMMLRGEETHQLATTEINKELRNA